MTLPVLYILRHGETEWNVQGRMQGRLDSALTAQGRAQAQRQADLLNQHLDGEVDWYVSPLGRAVQTAQIICGARGIAPQKDTRLREIEMGEWTGQTRDTILALRPDLPDLSFYDAAPEGEGIAALTKRLEDFLADLSAPSVIITHGITSRVMRCLATRRDPLEFGKIGGGQGIVCRISDGVQELLQ